MDAIDVTDKNFLQLVLISEKPALIDFGAFWCPSCKAMAPLIETIANKFDGTAIVGKVDVDINSDLVAQYDVRKIPTFLLFKNGQLTERIVGPISKRLLEEKLNALL